MFWFVNAVCIHRWFRISFIVFTGAPNYYKDMLFENEHAQHWWGIHCLGIHIAHWYWQCINPFDHRYFPWCAHLQLHSCTHTQNLFLFIAYSTLACNACIVIVFASGCWRNRMWMIYDLVTIYTEDMFCPWAFGRYHWQRGDSDKALAYSVSCSIHLNVWREDPATGKKNIVRCICFVVRGVDGLCGARRCIFQCRGALFWMYQFDVVARRWVFKIGDPHCTLTIGSL